MMNQKLKMAAALSLIGLLGFILGAAANLLYLKVLPFFLYVLPQLYGLEWALWGLVGALLAIICCLIYAYLP